MALAQRVAAVQMRRCPSQIIREEAAGAAVFAVIAHVQAGGSDDDALCVRIATFAAVDQWRTWTKRGHIVGEVGDDWREPAVFAPYGRVERMADVEIRARRLDDRTLDMLRLRAGGHTLAEIGDTYGVSESRVSQIITAALKKLG